MDKIVVLAEKPSVGRDIARVLKCSKKGNGYLEGDKYIVTWALGHLVTLADPEVYDEKYKTWRLDDLPMLPSSLKLSVIKSSGKQFHTVKAQLNRKDVKEIVIATDAGREGELVARWIIEKSYVKKPIKRLWISSVTDRAINDGFKSLKSGKEYETLYASAVARSEADWYVGLNATRALTSKFNAQLSCGRVQTPTIAMIAKREEEIRNFKPRSFYGMTATTEHLTFVWQEHKSKDIKTFDREKRDKLIQNIRNKNAEIIDVNKVYKKKFAPPLYDLTELQRDAHKIFGYSAKETLSILQKLYEQHKLATYPRTDSRYISTDIVDTLKDRVKACNVAPFSQLAAKVLKSQIKANNSFVDNQKVSDHHAIIPTEQQVIISFLNNRERKIHELIVKRFLAVLYPPFEYEQTTIKAKIGEEVFIAKGKKIIHLGWKEVYGKDAIEEDAKDGITEQILPFIQKGDTLKVINVVETSGKTNPPKPFNEGTLLSAMENPVKYMSDENIELVKTIGKTGGLGTVATRADIIEKLINSSLIERKGKDIVITSKGRQLLELVPTDLKSPELTAEWEQQLEAIAKGKLLKNDFISKIKNYTRVIVTDIKNSDQKFKHDNLTTKKCPDCGKRMLEIKGKRGRILVCQDRGCGYKKNVAKLTNARCPICHKKLELTGEGEGQKFICSCGHQEKLSIFNERKKKEKNNKVSKQDITKYLHKQKGKEEEPLNTALADALAKLKLDKE